ncbi:MAG TPA: hypothetical protein VD836_12235 [Solirubrobacteraceae bacterium]|nr:hypothetical protein [Solirubrobacteraceae bacterium]
MGKRSRKRGGAGSAPAAAAASADRPAREPRPERPRAPWHPFPLVELSVLIGLVLLVWGLIRGGEDGAVLLVAGMALASLAGLETALREHFTGHAPHALLIAALPAILVAGVVWFLDAPPAAVVIAGGAVLLGGTVALRRVFRPRR